MRRKRPLKQPEARVGALASPVRSTGPKAREGPSTCPDEPSGTRATGSARRAPDGLPGASAPPVRARQDAVKGARSSLRPAGSKAPPAMRCTPIGAAAGSARGQSRRRKPCKAARSAPQAAEVLDHCLQLHGGYGFMNEYRVGRAWRDARVTKIWAGSNEIMKELIGRDLGL